MVTGLEATGKELEQTRYQWEIMQRRILLLLTRRMPLVEADPAMPLVHFLLSVVLLVVLRVLAFP